jgi:ubiquitin-associated SH3 domain-containing protein
MEAELILYAVPTGSLAQAIAAFFDELAERPTTAQRFPPHCTLTGFFHDDADAIGQYVDAAQGVVRPVRVDVALRTTPEWIGLEVQSPDLLALARDFAAAAAPIESRRDQIRLKDWLHVSLAYGHDADATDELANLATKLVDPAADVGWALRVYERRERDWIVRGSWPLP